MSTTKAFAAAIVVRGARVNNLRGVDLDIPKRQLVVCRGDLSQSRRARRRSLLVGVGAGSSWARA